MKAKLNDSKVLAALRANARSTPRPKDWHPILDKIHQALGISFVWCPLKTLRGKKGSSALDMFYEDRTLFCSPRANKNYLPEWHDTAHAIVSRDQLDQPNWGMDDMDPEDSDPLEFEAQNLQIWLEHNFHSDPKIARKHTLLFRLEDDFSEVLEAGRQLAKQHLPELPEAWSIVP